MLTKLIAEGMDVETLADALVITPHQLEKYRSGRFAMPPERQLCLALFALEAVPRLASECRALRAQLLAAAAYNAGETITHNGPPVRHLRFPGARSPNQGS